MPVSPLPDDTPSKYLNIPTKDIDISNGIPKLNTKNYQDHAPAAIPNFPSVNPSLGFDPLGIKRRKQNAEIDKNNDIIRGKYNKLKYTLGSYAAVKKQFDIRGLYLPPETFFQPQILMAGIGNPVEAGVELAETVATGIVEGIASGIPALERLLPAPSHGLLDIGQQVTLIRDLNEVTQQIKANPVDTTTSIPVSATPTVDTSKQRPARPLRDTESIYRTITKEDYSDYKKPDTSSSSSSSSSSSIDISNGIPNSSSSSSSSIGIPNSGILDSMAESLDSMFDYLKPSPMQNVKPDKSIRQQHIDDENKEIEMTYSTPKRKPILAHQEKPKYHKPTQPNKLVASQTLSVLKAILSNSRGLSRIIRTQETKTITQIKTLITKTWSDNTELQKHILGLLNLYGIIIKSTGYRPGEVAKVVDQLMGNNPQVLNTFMNELIRILENDSRNKLKFLFEPVAPDSGTLAVEGAPTLETSVNLRDSELRKTVIDKLTINRVPKSAAIKWYDTLIEAINEQNHARFAELGYENYEKGREDSLKLLHHNIIEMLAKLADSNNLVFNISLIKELANLIFTTFKTPLSQMPQVLQEIVNTPVFEAVANELIPAPEAMDIRLPDITEAVRLLEIGIGNRIYHDTVFSWHEFEIVKAPTNPDDVPPDDDDPDGPLYQYYWFRYRGRRWVRVDVKRLVLIISIISSTIGIAFEIIKAIKEIHEKKESKKSKEKSKEKSKDIDISNGIPNEKEKSKEPDQKPSRPSRPTRTKRHGELP